MPTTEPMRLAKPSVHVRLVNNQNGGILLDIRNHCCLSLTAEAASVWSLLNSDHSLEEIAIHLAQDTHVSPQEASREVLAFIDTLTKLELLQTVRATRQPAYRQCVIRSIHRCSRLIGQWSTLRSVNPVWLFAKAFILLLIFDLLNLRKNFVELFQFVRDWPVSGRVPLPAAVDRVITAVNYACVFYPKWVRCLQRSAATTCLLRSMGIPAQTVIGAQIIPFSTHAWSEVNGRIIDERADDPCTPFILERL